MVAQLLFGGCSETTVELKSAFELAGAPLACQRERASNP